MGGDVDCDVVVKAEGFVYVFQVEEELFTKKTVDFIVIEFSMNSISIYIYIWCMLGSWMVRVVGRMFILVARSKKYYPLGAVASKSWFRGSQNVVP